MATGLARLVDAVLRRPAPSSGSRPSAPLMLVGVAAALTAGVLVSSGGAPAVGGGGEPAAVTGESQAGSAGGRAGDGTRDRHPGPVPVDLAALPDRGGEATTRPPVAPALPTGGPLSSSTAARAPSAAHPSVARPVSTAASPARGPVAARTGATTAQLAAASSWRDPADSPARTAAWFVLLGSALGALAAWLHRRSRG